MKPFKIILSLDKDGHVVIEGGEGLHGSVCEKMIEAVAKEAGQIKTSRKKHDFYATTTNANTVKQTQ